MTLGTGIAIAAMWGAVAVIGYRAPGAAGFLGLFAVIATIGAILHED